MAGPRYTQVFAVWGYIPSCSWNVGQCPLRVACAWKHTGETKWVLLPKHGPAPMCSQYMGNGQLSPLMVFHQHVGRLCHDDVEGKKTTNGWNPHTFLYTTTHIAHALPNMFFVVECGCRLFPAFLSPTNPNRHLYIYTHSVFCSSTMFFAVLESWASGHSARNAVSRISENQESPKNKARGVSAYYRLFWGYPQKPLWIETTFLTPKTTFKGVQ